MEDEEDDVFRPNARSWETTFREIKHEDRSTQTPGPALVHRFSMLPCGVAHEPRRLFYGNAGFRLHFPAHFERARNPEQGQRNRPEHHPRPSAEVRIGQKLQVIGDQFHQDQVELVRRTVSWIFQRNSQVESGIGNMRMLSVLIQYYLLGCYS
ncbi:BCL2 modifying factor 2 isoform X2 [Scleropages formosus]|uniref:BCL2 modifying factor 2 isoform X2 n=1 Tax=Scleropages formosus TaxID=113540 RepID=UPI000878E29B|nr:bcl-2-modifying factor isoform X2 [Scleropages formosus]